MRTLILAACCAALFAAPAPAQLAPGPLKPAAEDCIGCTNVQPPPVGGHDGCTSGDECLYVPEVPLGPNEGERVESPCWLMLCGGDGWPPPDVRPVICGQGCIVWNDVAQPADPEPAPADAPYGGELSGGGGCGDDSYCTGRHVTIGAT